MAGFHSLAPELILLILSSLSKASLASLSATSKTLHRHVNPILYQTIVCIFREPPLSDTLSIHLFFRSLWERPELATHVRRLHFQTEWEENDRHYITAPSAADNKRWFQAIQALGSLPFGRALKAGVQRGDIDALTTVLLAQLHNLEILELDYSFVHGCKLIGRMLKHASFAGPTSNLSRFLKLKEVYYRNDMDFRAPRMEVNLEPILSLFHLPYLETIEVVMPDLDATQWQNNQDIPTLPHLQTLRLLNSGAGVETLARILSITPNLHSLEYNYAQDMEELWEDEDYIHTHWAEWSALTSALEIVSSSLKNLTISIDFHFISDYKPESGDPGWVHGVWLRRGCMTPLQSLIHLERLEIPLPVLLGWKPAFPHKRLRDVLPPNLRELSLRDDMIDYQGYEWTPWNVNVIGREMAESFRNTCDPTPVIAQLRDYLLHHPDEDRRHHPASSLQVLCLKMQKDRLWPPFYLQILEDIGKEGKITCKIHLSTSGYLTRLDDWTDEVKEMIVYDPSSKEPKRAALERSQYRCRYFSEPSKLFREKC